MNYFKDMMRVAKNLKGEHGIFHVHVHHDDWCKFFKTKVPQDCDCNCYTHVEKEEENGDSN